MRKLFLIVSIDTECDKGPGWRIQYPMCFRNIYEGVPDVFTPLFSRHRIKATYLLSPEIMHNDPCVSVFKSLLNVELGTHLHEEFIDPIANWAADRTKSVQCDLVPSLEREKLSQLTKLFERQFGYRPTSFRAGRFGISSHTFGFLDELGYHVDSSVTPFKTHYYETGTVNNFWGSNPMPYRIKDMNLVQVPVTIINPDFTSLPRFILRLLEDKRTFARKVLNRCGFVSKSVWFRPHRSSTEMLIDIAEQVIHSYPSGKDPVLNMMFHSNEIIPAASPYCQTPSDVESYLTSLDGVFGYLNDKYQVCSVGLGEYAKYFH